MSPASSVIAESVATRYAAQIRELLTLQLALRNSQAAEKVTQRPAAQSPVQHGAAPGSSFDLRV